MYLNSDQCRILPQIMATLAEPFDRETLRCRLGELLLKLLRADYFASYQWSDTDARFVSRVSINMTDRNLHDYEKYYQFHDPITHVLRQRLAPTRVTQILPQDKLRRTEFFNDFLWRDGLYWGLNLHIPVDGTSTADFRIWRSRVSSDFEDGDLELLKMITPAVSIALRRSQHREQINATPALQQIWHCAGLTARELETAMLAARGLPDKEIARQLGISFTTVRTHLKHAFRKLDLDNRVQLAASLRTPF
jgi:DNA-binding CsgD family transcriptional regulator